MNRLLGMVYSINYSVIIPLNRACHYFFKDADYKPMFKDFLTVGKLVGGLFGLFLFKVHEIQVLLAPQSAFSNIPKIFFQDLKHSVGKKIFFTNAKQYYN